MIVASHDYFYNMTIIVIQYKVQKSIITYDHMFKFETQKGNVLNKRAGMQLSINLLN